MKLKRTPYGKYNQNEKCVVKKSVVPYLALNAPNYLTELYN